ncbi:Do family serine endopeptidase [Chthonobacter rhizosphaerae]|uniref:Do family serine endopeptidase n=1 Tax=Chthonobacter rhizosphaerae TaxID=2735553 RepID=UPI0015EF3537|nr:Do family serine endopeptidase [Chthonobacter rhizosphaerae]
MPHIDKSTRFVVAVPALALALSVGAAVPAGVALAQTPPVPADQSMGFADVVERVQPAVVSVRVSRGAAQAQTAVPAIPEDHPLRDFFRRFGEPGNRDGIPTPDAPRRETALGSGFFISADGYVVTNNHVVEGGGEYRLVSTDGREHEATLVGADPQTDLALLKVENATGLPFVEFADDPVRVGQWVLAVGNPFGLGGSVTAGIVSARGRDIGAGPYDDFIQIDAPINQGNSGGPAFNLDGKVVGVNTAIFSPSGGSVGIGFAIPASTAKQVVEDLKDDGRVVRGWLGVQIQPVTPEIAGALGLPDPSGALVSEPQPNAPAAQAGIEAGDVIRTVDGQPIEDSRDLARTIAGIAPGTTVELGLWRDGKQQTLSVDLGTLPGQRQVAAAGGGQTSLADFGLELSSGPSGDVVVTAVTPGSEADQKGLRQGDVILEVAGGAVSSPQDVRERVASAEGADKPVLMRIRSNGSHRFVALERKPA